MILIVMPALWFWEEPSYYPDSLWTDPKMWSCGFAYSPLGSYDWHTHQ